jgi:hypothetical protein|tara:strand:+ start:61 stop:210 length:150 start_codon:yes stop_codon:yes gene_type:complete
MAKENTNDVAVHVTGVSMSGKAEVKKDDTIRRVEADQKPAENTETNDSE